MMLRNLISSSFAVFILIQAAAGGRWLQLSRNVCFEGKGDSYGKITVGRNVNGFMIAMQLRYKSGGITCWEGMYVPTKWGCDVGKPGDYFWGKQNVCVIITDEQNQQVFPQSKVVPNRHGFYNLPGFTAYSQHLIFADFDEPRYVTKGKVFHLWYGEDLKKVTDQDNGGRVCVDVYAKFA